MPTEGLVPVSSCWISVTHGHALQRPVDPDVHETAFTTPYEFKCAQFDFQNCELNYNGWFSNPTEEVPPISTLWTSGFLPVGALSMADLPPMV